MDLLASLTARLWRFGLNEVPQNLVLVPLHHVRDAAVAECKQTSRVPHGGVAEGARYVQLLEIRELLLDDLHTATDVPGTHVGEAT